mgnify:CR=1 FL=1
MRWRAFSVTTVLFWWCFATGDRCRSSRMRCNGQAGTLVWDKLTSRPQKGRFRQQAEFVVWASNGKLPIDRPVPVLPGVFRATNVQGVQRIHQTQKPEEIMRQICKICLPGGRILDPFAGSGSTLAAAELEGYDSVGVELSEEIAKSAAQRLSVPLKKVGD